VGFHGRYADVQFRCDGLIAAAAPQELDDAPLPIGEPFSPICPFRVDPSSRKGGEGQGEDQEAVQRVRLLPEGAVGVKAGILKPADFGEENDGTAIMVRK
jgi:hypothetical protein